ncbi:HD domain-containing protein [Streptomyces sp. NPDC005283]|uniref:HD domain-containing protein n=1 Tax=Streptomyces sp. NPDC005283 TaxID=3156871 RepID=UPI003454BE7F
MKARWRLAVPSLAPMGTGPSLDSILAAVRSHHPEADPGLLKRAYAEAVFWHEGHKRHSGDPVLTHCLTVAAIIADLRMPPPAVCAALLHDLEDTDCPPSRVTDQFGKEIADLVTAVPSAVPCPFPRAAAATKPSAMSADPAQAAAALAIRLADRLHNMRTIAFVAQDKQHRHARETLEVLAPLAHATGLESVGRELQDLASAVLRPAPSSHALAHQLLTTLTLLLPEQERPRWQEEWTAELAAHTTRSARTRFALRVLLAAPRLSMTLRHPPSLERR